MILEFLYEYLQEWHTMDEILNYLDMSKKDNRMIRLAFANWNDQKETDMPFIAHSHLGYRFTIDKNEILSSCNDDIKRIRTLAKKVKKALYQVHTSDNFNIYDYLDI